MKNNGLKGPRVIILMAILIVVVILILGNQSFKATEKAAFDEFNQRQLVLSTGAAGGIELYFENLAGDLRALARVPEIQRLDEAPTRRGIQHTFEKLEPLGVNDVGVLDADGVLKYNVAAQQIEGDDFSWRGYFQKAKEMTSSDPYIVEFIECKAKEEQKAWSLIEAGYDPALDGEAYSSVFFQNSNNSVRVNDQFMEKVVDDESWYTKAVTNGEKIGKYRARNVLKAISEATHICGDPGFIRIGGVFCVVEAVVERGGSLTWHVFV